MLDVLKCFQREILCFVHCHDVHSRKTNNASYNVTLLSLEMCPHIKSTWIWGYCTWKVLERSFNL